MLAVGNFQIILLLTFISALGFGIASGQGLQCVNEGNENRTEICVEPKGVCAIKKSDLKMVGCVEEEKDCGQILPTEENPDPKRIFCFPNVDYCCCAGDLCNHSILACQDETLLKETDACKQFIVANGYLRKVEEPRNSTTVTEKSAALSALPSSMIILVSVGGSFSIRL